MAVKKNQIKATWRNDDVFYEWGGAVSKADAHLLHNAFFHVRMFSTDKPLLEELEDRGYDISTLRFSIKKARK